MPRSKRPPIDYTPQFGAGIFRSPEAVAEELAELAPEEGSGVAEATTVVDDDRRPPIRRSGDTRLTKRTNEAPNVRTFERARVRHSFDVYEDQLLALTEIQAERFTRTRRKPKLGELVQEALDAYIEDQRKRTNVRTNGRTKE
jgi:hypothetical protein